MDSKIIDFPKIKSPFKRVRNEKGRYVCTSEIEEGFEWVFQDGVRAVDKLHGTNICVVVLNGNVHSIDNRTTRVFESGIIPCRAMSSRFLMGVFNAISRGWLESEGRYYGELIGPCFNGNLHDCPEYLFVPFSVLYEKYHWHSWVNNKYPKDFQSISDWFKTLPSLFSDRHLKQKVIGEGIVFHSEDGKMAKLRRDMFDWYEGEEHGSDS